MSAWSIDTLLRVMDLAAPSRANSDMVMLLENGGSPVTGDCTRKFPDGKARLDIKGWSWGQIVHAVGAAAEGTRNYTPLTVVRQADSATASLGSLAQNRTNKLKACLSVYRAGGDKAGADTLPMFEFEIDEAQIVGQYFVSGTDDVLSEILVFSYRGIEIRSSPQKSTGARGAERTCQIVVGAGA